LIINRIGEAMKYPMFFLFVFTFILTGCSNQSDDMEFKRKYVEAFVEGCSKTAGGNELMQGICACQANKIVEKMEISDMKDSQKVQQFVLQTAAYECTQEAMQNMQK
jgi:hypothetical protein